MDWSVYLSKRIDYDSCVDVDQYLCSMAPLFGSLVNDLEKFLDKEGRYFGIAVHYVHSLRESIKELEPEDRDVDIEERVMFLYKPLIIKVYKKYVHRGLSRADSIICVLRTICSTVLSMGNSSALLSMYGVLEKLYNNIKNGNKEYVYKPLEEVLIECIESGQVGLYKSKSISVIDEEKKRKIKVPLDGSGIRIDKSFDNEVTEISWTDD